MAVVSKNYLLEAGVHFGHQTKRWNPKMKEYIFAAREDIYIIDLAKTEALIEEAYVELKKICENGGKALFVGTKKQAQDASKEEAIRCNGFYVTERWLGGTLTNFRTIRARVKRLEEIEKMEKEGKFDILPKKEVIKIKKEYDKLNKLLCGIRDMVKLPKALIIVDPRKEINAIREARKLNIPVFGIVDTNCDPDDVDFVIPANDDAVRSVKLILGVLTNAICEVNNLEMIDFTGDVHFSDERKNQPLKGKYDTVEEYNNNKFYDKKKNKRDFKKESRKDFKKEYKQDFKKDFNKNETVKEEVKQIKNIVEPKNVVKKEFVKTEKVEKVEKIEKEITNNVILPNTLAELKALAKERGHKGYSTMKKAELINLLK